MMRNRISYRFVSYVIYTEVWKKKTTELTLEDQLKGSFIQDNNEILAEIAAKEQPKFEGPAGEDTSLKMIEDKHDDDEVKQESADPSLKGKILRFTRMIKKDTSEIFASV